MPARPVRPLEKTVHPQDPVLDELRCTRAVSLEQEKPLEQVWLLSLLQNVKEQENVLDKLDPALEHHKERLYRA